jgi:hypothetical protein
VNAFQEHALNLATSQGEQAGGSVQPNGQPVVNPRLLGPTLTFPVIGTGGAGLVVGVSVSPLIYGFRLDFGRSTKQFVEKCEFPASDIPLNVPGTVPPVLAASVMKQGLLCILKQFPADPGIQMQLWTGGTLMGGLVYRFMLVNVGYSV